MSTISRPSFTPNGMEYLRDVLPQYKRNRSPRGLERMVTRVPMYLRFVATFLAITLLASGCPMGARQQPDKLLPFPT
jgi:hypothetical protein